MQTSTSLTVVVQGADEPTLKTRRFAARPASCKLCGRVRRGSQRSTRSPFANDQRGAVLRGVEFEGCTRPDGACLQRLLDSLDECSERVSEPGVAVSEVPPTALQWARHGKIDARFTVRDARKHNHKSMMAPRRRWETNTAGDVR